MTIEQRFRGGAHRTRELAIALMKGFGIYEFYRQMAEAQTSRESALIAAPDPRQQRHEAILAERSRATPRR